MSKIDGRKIAIQIIEELKKKETSKGILAGILVGENEAAQSFLKIKKKIAQELGVDFRIYEMPEDISTNKLREEVNRIAQQGGVKGLIVQLPLPSQLNRERVLAAIPKEKDVDLLNKKNWRTEGYLRAPAVETVLEIFKNQMIKEEEFKNMKMAIVGFGFLIGEPVGGYFLGKVKKLTVFEEGNNLDELREYDLVISGVGKEGVITLKNLKEEAGVIDFGYERGRGDLEMALEQELDKLKFWTPTPGGTGPILVANLFKNFYKLDKNRKK